MDNKRVVEQIKTDLTGDHLDSVIDGVPTESDTEVTEDRGRVLGLGARAIVLVCELIVIGVLVLVVVL